MWDPKLSGQNVSVLDDHKKEFENSQVESGFLSGPQTYSSSDIGIEVDEDLSAKHISAQQQNNFQQSFTDSGLVSDLGNSEQISDKDIKPQSNMILDSRVDSGLSEWFCNLNLDNSAQPINNLSSTIEKKEQKAQRDLQANLWKLYYRQDEEGDT